MGEPQPSSSASSPELIAAEAEKRQLKMTGQDLAVLTHLYDINGDGEIQDNELAVILADYKAYCLNPVPYSSKSALTKKILDKYNDGSDFEGVLSAKIHDAIAEERIRATRYAAYTSSFARAARYLAFTSDLGEALRPVIASRLVTITYLISFGYCFADVGYEGYKLHSNNYIHEKSKEPMTMTQCVVERGTFQGIASIVAPFVVIHTSVNASHAFLKKFSTSGRLNRWGPSLFGLAMIPLFPKYFDGPLEELIEHCFEHYGPWKKGKSHEE